MGFTLVELLVVIAIIAILVGLTAAALPRVLERAKIADAETDFANIRNALVDYYTKHETFPLPYGFRTWKSEQDRKAGTPGWDDTSDSEMFNFVPYMDNVKEYGSVGLYDRFAEVLDTNSDEFISRLEYSPLLPLPGGHTLFGGAAPGPGMEGPQRPYVYAPINQQVFRLFLASAPANTVWDGAGWPSWAAGISTLVSPRYDAFVLISVGPERNSYGLAVPSDEAAFIASLPIQQDAYQALALRCYYLATRDANKNYKLDFDFRTRTREDEAEALANFFSDPQGHRLPDGSFKGGPLIYRYEG